MATLWNTPTKPNALDLSDEQQKRVHDFLYGDMEKLAAELKAAVADVPRTPPCPEWVWNIVLD